MELTRLEFKFYNPSATHYTKLFHKPNATAGIYTSDKELEAHANSFGIGKVDETTKIVFTVNEPIIDC
jgi:hypothetical protein